MKEVPTFDTNTAAEMSARISRDRTDLLLSKLRERDKPKFKDEWMVPKRYYEVLAQKEEPIQNPPDMKEQEVEEGWISSNSVRQEEDEPTEAQWLDGILESLLPDSEPETLLDDSGSDLDSAAILNLDLFFCHSEWSDSGVEESHITDLQEQVSGARSLDSFLARDDNINFKLRIVVDSESETLFDDSESETLFDDSRSETLFDDSRSDLDSELESLSDDSNEEE